MSAGQAFVGIDAGTTGCTVMIFDESGNRLGQGYQEYPCTSPRPGWIEQDVEEVWRGICEATKQAMAAAALPDSAYKSVGFSSQRGTFILLDEDKNTDRAVDRLERRTGAGVPGEVRQGDLAGRLPDPHRHAALAAVVGREDRLAARQRQGRLPARRAGSPTARSTSCTGSAPHDWVTDPASLTLNGMLEIEKLDWSDRVLALCGIDRDRVPPVGIPSGQAGTLSATAARRDRACPRASRSAGARATSSARRSAPAWCTQGMAEFTVGTAGVMVAHLDSLDRIQGRNLWWGGHAVPGAWDIEGGAFALGASLKWWRDNLGRNEQIEADAQRQERLLGDGGQGA